MSILDEAKTVPVAGDGVALLYCAIILLVLTWVVFSLRVGVRLWRKVFGTDDYLMLVGQVSEHSLAVHDSGVVEEYMDSQIDRSFSL